MNRLIAANEAGGIPVRRPDIFSAVVSYEDRFTRDCALSTCQRLVNGFKDDIEFEFGWWRFDFLAERRVAREAVKAATRADLILFSAHADKELPSQVKRWIDAWSLKRRRALQCGILVAMIGTAEDQLRGMTPIHVYLREVAQQASLDYLPHVLHSPVDHSMEAISRRAEKVTSLLDNMLHRLSIPPRSCLWLGIQAAP